MEVTNVIKALKSQVKLVGLLKLQTEHFKLANVWVLSCLLCILFNTALSHGYLPIIKDKRGLLTDKTMMLQYQ